MPVTGPLEIGLIVALAVLLVGYRRLPQAGRALGRATKEFAAGRQASTDEEQDQ